MIEIIETAKLSLMDVMEQYDNLTEQEKVIVNETIDILKRIENNLGDEYKEDIDPKDFFNKSAGIIRPNINRDNLKPGLYSGKGLDDAR